VTFYENLLRTKYISYLVNILGQIIIIQQEIAIV